MMSLVPWIERRWSFDLPVSAFPAVLERLRGLPARAAALVERVPEVLLAARPTRGWSVKEHLGHLNDLHALDLQRVDEFLAGAAVLTAADPANHRTTVANHNTVATRQLLERLEQDRRRLILALESMGDADIARTARHPRLGIPMRLIDWAEFVADHDDHHLAAARYVLSSPTTPPQMRTRTTERQQQTAAVNAQRDLFEIPEGVTYLNCANMGPQLRAVTQAGVLGVHGAASPWARRSDDWFAPTERLRALFARIVNADADGIALVPSVSYGIAVAAANVPIASNQSIVLLDGEFPSNVYAWRELARRRGAVVRTVARRSSGSWTEPVVEAIGPDTAVVSVPNCHWTDGRVLDLTRVAAAARRVGAAVIIDGSQTVGAYPMDVASIQPDFLVTVGYKWLLGPYGLGYLYAAPRWRAQGVPLEHSWLTRAGAEDFARLTDYSETFRPGARRFDMGEYPQFVLTGMAIAALEQVLAWGVDRIQREVAVLTSRLERGAFDAGADAVAAADRVDHLIGIRPRSGMAADLIAALAEAKVYVSIRGDVLRVAPHVFNTAADIDRLLKVLQSRS